MSTSPDIKDLIISRSLLIETGQAALYIINKRTAAGEFLPGSTGSSQYSTTPLPLPVGALTAKGIDTLNALLDSGEATAFKSKKSGRLWVILEHGYKQFRELAGRETDHVTLNWTGALMRGLTITSVDTNNAAVELGWNDPRSSEIARYHNELGAGKSRVTHKFLGITPKELSLLARQAEQSIRQKA